MNTEFLEDSVYRKYDMVVGETLAKIYENSKEEEIIRLFWFDRKKKEHWYLLRIALIARDIFQYPVVLQGISWWDQFRINRKLGKGFDRVKRDYPGVMKGISVPHMLDLIRAECEKKIDDEVNFVNIYEAYYERKM